MDSAENHLSLATFAFDYHGAKVDPDSTGVFGRSFCGDMQVFTLDGFGGWLNHATHEFRLIGTIGDTINWVFSELLAGQLPEYSFKDRTRHRT